MLLKVNTRTLHSETYLDTWHIGGRYVKLKRPFDPYFYAPSNPASKSTNMAESIQRHCRQPPSNLFAEKLSRFFNASKGMLINHRLSLKLQIFTLRACMHLGSAQLIRYG